MVAGVPLGTVPFHETSLHRRSSRNEIPLTELPAKVSVKRSCSSDSFLEVDVSQPEPVESEISRVLGRLKSSSRSNSGAATPSGISPLCISLSTSLNETGMPSPRPNGTAGKPGQVTSRRSTAAPQFYDIDNIIIDPSVAAVTRVEKLQYKEIMTPGLVRTVETDKQKKANHMKFCYRWKEIDNYMEDGSHPLEVSEEMDSSVSLRFFSRWTAIVHV